MVIDKSHHTEGNIQQAHFSPELKLIFTLDNLSDHIKIFDTSCNLKRIIKARKEVSVEEPYSKLPASLQQTFVERNSPDEEEELTGTVLLDFAFSSSELKIAACAKNFTIFLWDYNENFGYQSTLKTFQNMKAYQQKIWYLKYMNRFVTTDETKSLNVWDIEKGLVIQSIKLPGFRQDLSSQKDGIIDVEQIGYLELVAIATSEKFVYVYNLEKEQRVITLDIKMGGVHSLCFFEDYQVLLAAGYENTIPVFQLSPHYLDLDIVGRLVGHLTLITAISALEGTPMVFTADDTGVIKCWDIRKFTCFQTIQVGKKSNLTCFLDLENGKLGLIGQRVVLMEFESKKKMTKSIKQRINSYIPVGVDFHADAQEIVLVCQNEIKFLDFNTGRCKRVLVNIFDPELEDEITNMQLVAPKNILILGNYRGEIKIIDYFSGKIQNNIPPISNEVIFLYYDKLNRLLMTSSRNGELKISREYSSSTILSSPIVSNNDADSQNEADALKENSLSNKEMEMDPKKDKYTMTAVQRVRAKLIERQMISTSEKEGIQEDIQADSKFSGLKNVKGFKNKTQVNNVLISVYQNIFILLTQDGFAQIYHYENFKLLKIIQFTSQSPPVSGTILCGFNRFIIGDQSGKLHFFRMVFKNGVLITVVLESQYSFSDLKSSNRGLFDYNLSDAIPDLFVADISLLKNGNHFKSSPHKPGSRLPDVSLGNGSQGIKVSSSDLFLADSYGGVHHFNIRDILGNIDIQPHSCTTYNYNPYRAVNLGSSNSYGHNNSNLEVSKMEEEKPNLIRKMFRNSFRPHDDQIVSLELVALENKYIMSFDYSLNFKLYNKNGMVLCYLNMSHPLPLLWNVPKENILDAREKVVFALKLIEVIERRFKDKNNLLSVEAVHFQLTNNDRVFELTSVKNHPLFMDPSSNKKNDKVILMKDEYTRKDFAFQKVEPSQAKEILGKSLRSTDIIKKSRKMNTYSFLQNTGHRDIYGGNLDFERKKEKKKRIKQNIDFFKKGEKFSLFNSKQILKDGAASRLMNQFLQIESKSTNIGDTQREKQLLSKRSKYQEESCSSSFLDDLKERARKRVEDNSFHVNHSKVKNIDFLAYASKKKLVNLSSRKKNAGQQMKNQTMVINGNKKNQKFYEVLRAMDKRLDDIQKRKQVTNQTVMDLNIQNQSLSKKSRRQSRKGINPLQKVYQVQPKKEHEARVSIIERKGAVSLPRIRRRKGADGTGIVHGRGASFRANKNKEIVVQRMNRIKERSSSFNFANN